MPTIGIIGLGLLGTSLGMALRNKGWFRTGWTRRNEVRAIAVEQDYLDQVFSTPQQVLNNADLTVLALPIPEIINFIRTYANEWKPRTVVTDLGSVKAAVCNVATAVLEPSGVYYVGSHPMAGTEKSGPESAFPELYNNADVFICPLQNTPESAIKIVEKLWSDVGTHSNRIDAKSHDLLVAHTSHVLHVLASALSSSILDAPDEKTRNRHFQGCATGFRDSSRIASSNPRMWREIVEYNQPAILAALDDFERDYYEFKEFIIQKNFDGFEQKFAHGKSLRDSWIEYKKRRH